MRTLPLGAVRAVPTCSTRRAPAAPAAAAAARRLGSVAVPTQRSTHSRVPTTVPAAAPVVYAPADTFAAPAAAAAAPAAAAAVPAKPARPSLPPGWEEAKDPDSGGARRLSTRLHTRGPPQLPAALTDDVL
jgi:DNA polymerase-3 subunit gamma/tau